MQSNISNSSVGKVELIIKKRVITLMKDFPEIIEKAASALKASNRVVAFCGSGFSEESGISTFRDPGGLWDIVDPWEVGTLQGFINTIKTKNNQLLQVFRNIIDSFEKSEPNPGHLALYDLESMDKLQAVITQNIDNLHQEAGNSTVIEVHGNLFRMKCLGCGNQIKVDRKQFIEKTRKELNKLTDFDFTVLMNLAEKCRVCGNFMRPDVVMFGEAVQYLDEAYDAAIKADLLLILGTSGVVYPAADIPIQASRSGAKIIEINPTENAFVNITDIYIPMKSGVALPSIVELLN
ncbi:NAD-dependent protein deacylase [bacterium]|nr:NAD-dependent protein deacylase [bacterium]